jgi:glycosyltransferase involved in cell wall biosynthesis
MTRPDDDVTVLGITGFTQNPGKFERHVGPLADVVDGTTVVSRVRYETVDGVTYRYAPLVGNKYAELVFQFVLALYYGLRGEYDLIVSFSLFPYGLFALVVGVLSRTPTHLGVLGADVDVHATSWYRIVPILAFRAFDVVTVPGEVHRERLDSMGVTPETVVVLPNPVDVTRYAPAPEVTPEYDFIWVGRFSEEKAPLRFVRALDELADTESEFSAVMLGDGPMLSSVESALERYDLTDRVDLPGWVDDPLPFYRRARVFVLTSSRDALPLTLVEAMATGLPSVAPRVGAVPDLVDHMENGYLVSDPTPSSYAAALARLSTDDESYERLRANATAIRDRYSYEQARTAWVRTVATVDEPSPKTAAGRDYPINN